jgi:hypothetical protein
MAVSSTRRLVVRVEGVSHEIARAELIDVRLCYQGSGGPPTDFDGNTARVFLLCAMGRDLYKYVDPRTIVNVPDGAGIDCMTCLVRKARA